MQMQSPIPVLVKPASRTALNLTAPAVIKPAPATLVTVLISAPGTAGNLTFNDNNSLTGNSAANQIVSSPFSGLKSGTVLSLKFACTNGIVLSSVPTGAVLAVSFI